MSFDNTMLIDNAEEMVDEATGKEMTGESLLIKK